MYNLNQIAQDVRDTCYYRGLQQEISEYLNPSNPDDLQVLLEQAVKTALPLSRIQFYVPSSKPEQAAVTAFRKCTSTQIYSVSSEITPSKQFIEIWNDKHQQNLSEMMKRIEQFALALGEVNHSRVCVDGFLKDVACATYSAPIFDWPEAEHLLADWVSALTSNTDFRSDKEEAQFPLFVSMVYDRLSSIKKSLPISSVWSNLESWRSHFEAFAYQFYSYRKVCKDNLIAGVRNDPKAKVNALMVRFRSISRVYNNQYVRDDEIKEKLYYFCHCLGVSPRITEILVTNQLCMYSQSIIDFGAFVDDINGITSYRKEMLVFIDALAKELKTNKSNKMHKYAALMLCFPAMPKNYYEICLGYDKRTKTNSVSMSDGVGELLSSINLNPAAFYFIKMFSFGRIKRSYEMIYGK